MARPSKLTREVADSIVNAVNGGASYRYAAEYAGVSRSTFHSWCERARAARESKSKSIPSNAKFLEFLDRIERANAAAVVRAAAQVTRAAGSDWRAAAWLLERRDPDTYSTRQRVEVSGSETGPPVPIVAIDGNEALAAAHDYLRRVRGKPSGD